MIPVYETIFLGNEKKYVNECLDSGWISSEGAFVKRFEEAMADRFQMPHAVAVNSGTAALETALYALNLPEGSEVIMPSLTIISCALACLRLSLVPVLVDVDPFSWTMDATQVETKITSRTRAILAVHLFGNPVDMSPLVRVAKEHRIQIVEDFAEAHGARYKTADASGWSLCGSIGDISATSFYANKLISCGEGGMVLCRSEEAAERARRYRNLGFDARRSFIHQDIAANFRMGNLQAALGLAQLEQLDRAVALKKEIAGHYRAAFSNIDGVLRFHPVPAYSDPVYWMFCVELDSSRRVDAESAREALRKRAIGTRPLFIGMHRQPVLLKRNLFQGESYPRTDHVSRYAFYLPSALSLAPATVQSIASKVVDAVSSLRLR